MTLLPKYLLFFSNYSFFLRLIVHENYLIMIHHKLKKKINYLFLITILMIRIINKIFKLLKSVQKNILNLIINNLKLFFLQMIIYIKMIIIIIMKSLKKILYSWLSAMELLKIIRIKLVKSQRISFNKNHK